MSSPSPVESSDVTQKRIVESAIRLCALAGLIVLCFTIVQPFLMPVIGGMIVAVAVYPPFIKLSRALGGRTTVAAALLSILLIAAIVVPALMLTDSFIDGAQAVVAAGEADELKVPSPPAKIEDLPIIGPRIHAAWESAAKDPPGLILEFKPQIQAIGTWLLSIVSGTSFTLLRILVSFCIAGVLLAKSQASEQAAQALATRLAGNRGQELASIAVSTIRSVAVGVVAVSIVQTILLSIGFLAADLPAVGLLALIVLILCVVQLGPTFVTIPTIIYVYSTMDVLPATLYAIWTLAMTFIDSALKPMAFGRGASVPTLVIFIGAMGGMLSFGIIGLFIGAVVLSVGYKLYEVWLAETVTGDDTVDRRIGKTDEGAVAKDAAPSISQGD